MKFDEYDADDWFMRNEKSLTGQMSDPPFQVMSGLIGPYITDNMNVLEIGCSNGARLNQLNRLYPAKYYGVDLSSVAINHGKRLFGEIELSIQNAGSLEFENSYFDLVILGFFLYLVDRQDYNKIVAEASRVLKVGGYLGILDFDVPHPYNNIYAHNTKLKAYKCDNSEAFIATRQYTLIEKKTFSHEKSTFVPEIDDRISFQVLHKECSMSNSKGNNNVQK